MTMADANKEVVPDGTEHKSDDKTQQQINQPKTYEESYVKELIAERDRAKEKLRKVAEQTDADAKKREEETLKAKNDYEGLVKLHQAEHEKAINSAKSLIVNNFLAKLAVKHGLN